MNKLLLTLSLTLLAAGAARAQSEGLALSARAFDASAAEIMRPFILEDSFAGVGACGVLDIKTIRAWSLEEASDLANPCLKAVGLKDKRGYYWRSSLQEPVALLWILPLCLALGTALPILFFTMHIVMDYSVRFEKMPLYPYSNWVTRGFLIDVPDKVKEAIVFTAALCTNALLYFSAR